MLAPIALVAYRRPRHLARVIESLLSNREASETEVYAFSDAPKNEAAASGVAEVRRVLDHLTGFKSVEIVHRAKNLGLAGNTTGSISAVLERRDRVILVEDDFVVSRYFLSFMNAALSQYRDESSVGCVSGYCYPLDRRVGETFFIRGAEGWACATWRDRWHLYNPDGRALLAELRSRGLTSAFDLGGAMGFTRMLADQIAGKNDSWAVRWHASCFLRNLLVLYPGRSLAMNIGDDGSGTHTTGISHAYDVTLSSEPITVGGVPIEESAPGREAIRRFFLTAHPPQSPFRRAVVRVLDRLGIGDTLRRLLRAARSARPDVQRSTTGSAETDSPCR